MNSINYKTIKVDELDIFYREAGNKKKSGNITSSRVSFLFLYVQGFDKRSV